MQQKKLYTKGLDSDTAFEFMDEGRDRYRNNVRVLSSDTGNVGAIETVNGNTLVVNSLIPVGVSTVIGSYEYQLTRKIYYFVHNTSGLHSIIEFDQVAETFALVFQSIILNFKLEALITGINVIALDPNNHLLYWTDGWINPLNPDDFNQPKKINIEKGIAFCALDYVNGYKFPFDPEILFRIKRPPTCPPEYAWSGLDDSYVCKISNSSTNTFDIIGFQPAMTLRFDTPYYDPGAVYNPANGRITIVTPGDYSISAQIKIYDTHASTIVGIYGYVNILVNGISVAETMSARLDDGYTTSIQASATLNLLAGDIVTFASHGSPSGHFTVLPVNITVSEAVTTATNINHLFKKLFVFKVQFVYDDYEISAWSPISNYKFPKTTGSIPSGEDIVLQDNLITIDVPTGSSIVTKIRIAAKEIGNFTAPQLSSIDFSLIAELNKSELQLLDNVIYQYAFTNEVNGVPLEVNESIKLFDNVPLTSPAQELIKGIRLVDGNITENYNPVPIDMRLILSYVQAEVNENTFFPKNLYQKSGSLKQWGIVYYDYFNRSGTTNVIKGKSTVLLQNGTYGTSLYIPFLTEDTYNPAFPDGRMDYVPQINADIYNEPPVWATHYQIVSSQNQIMGRYIQFTAQAVRYIDVDGNTVARSVATRIEVNISNITGRYKTENPLSTLVYDYITGDRIRFIASPATTSSPTSFDTITPFLQFNDTAIDSYSTSTENLYIPINNNPILRDANIDRGVLFEIYDPTVPVINEGELIYELGECYDISVNALGQRIHKGSNGDQLRYAFANDVFQAGTVGFIGIGISGLAIGDKIKATSSVYNQNNTYGTVTNVVTSGVVQTISTTIPWATNSVTNSGTLTKAATVVLTGGDCFRRYCNMPHVNVLTYRLYSYIETMAASNMFTSNAWDYGRPNRIDDKIKRTTRPSTICYSNIFVPETFINGLSSTSDLNFETYEVPYGGIYNLDADDQQLTMYQELKIAQIPVQQGVVSTTSGENIVGVSAQVLSPTARYANAEYGIGRHPESFARYAQAKYGIDVKRGVVWRLSTDGLTPISEYFQHIYFTNLCKKIMLSATKVKIYGVFDIRFGEYIVAVEPFTYNGIDEPAQTIAFNEKANEWSTHYSIFPENMVNNGVNIIAFKAGKLYKQNENPIQNNFFGVQYHSEVHSVCNANPSNVKVLEAISEESNDAWEVYSISTPNGQESNLIESDFQEKENMQYAAVLFDANTPNVLNPLIEGDTLRDVTFLTKLRYNPTIYNKLFAINYEYIISNRHNK